MGYSYDAIVVGAGPNGLAAAITLARAGCSVLVLEAAAAPGGGMRSAELTLPGFVHDVCATVHALALASPFFQTLPLAEYGVVWAHPDAPLAHPLPDGNAAVLERSIDLTADSLGSDARAYERLMSPLVRSWRQLAPALLGPLLRLPRHPLALARFGFPGLLSTAGLLRATGLQGPRARGLLAGLIAHSMLPLEAPASAAFGLVLAITGHAVGWPVVRGGSQRLTGALVSYLETLGGEVQCGERVQSLAHLPPARAVLCDLTPRQLLAVAEDRMPGGYRRALARYRYGLGVFKLDWALAGPIPWIAAGCRRAGTVHLGGTAAEVAASERDAWQGRHSVTPYTIVVQATTFDPTRAPAGRHTAWAYCHVPSGSTVDMTQAIENQIERFAPGFRDLVLARSARSAAWYEAYNGNYVGGDINGGVQNLRQLIGRPVLRHDPYATPVKGLYICSAATPPGGGVHGMGGYYAAQSALRHM